MSIMETSVNTILSYLTKGTIFIGIIICLTSVTFAIWFGLRKRKTKKEIKSYLRTFLLGVFISSSGLMLNLVANFELNYDSYKRDIPIGYIVLLIICVLFINIRNVSAQGTITTSEKNHE